MAKATLLCIKIITSVFQKYSCMTNLNKELADAIPGYEYNRHFILNALMLEEKNLMLNSSEEKNYSLLLLSHYSNLSNQKKVLNWLIMSQITTVMSISNCHLK